MTKHSSEVDLAADIIRWLESNGWECFSEVCVGDAPCDIIATKCSSVWAIECKLQLSWHLLAQARRHVESANFVSIAIPYMRTDWEDRQLIRDVLEFLGIGLITCRKGDSFENVTSVSGKFRPINTEHYRSLLTENHKTFARAGSNRGYWTPFKCVQEAVALFVRDNPGCSIKEICTIEAVKTYYKKEGAAKSNLRQWLRKGVIKHVRCENDHGKTKYFPFDPATEPRI